MPGRDSWAVGTGVVTGLSTTGVKSGPDPVFRTPHHGGMAMKRLQDKIAIITGGSGGIGKAVAERFLGEGARVMLGDIDQDGLDATRQALGGGDRIAIAKADVSNESDVARYVEATVGALGRIDVFFNNAGIEGKVAPLEEQDISMFDKVIAINVRGAYLGLKHVLPHMYTAGAGSVGKTSSVAIGRASSRERVGQYVSIWVGCVSIKKKIKTIR